MFVPVVADFGQRSQPESRQNKPTPRVHLENASMSTPQDSAARSAVRDSDSTSAIPKSSTPPRSVTSSKHPDAVGAAKPNLASSIQALKELTSRSGTIFAAPATSSLTGEPLSTAYEKRIRTLQETLKERDQVVQMLTQRLEQAADQLDRVQRTGSGRAGSAVAGLPPELIENQQTLLDQLTRALGDWEATQAGQTLSRIESQITDLHDLVASGTSLRASTVMSAAPPKTSAPQPAAEAPKATARNSVLAEIASGGKANTSWEMIKAAMMEADYSDPAAASPSAASAATIGASPAFAEIPSVQVRQRSTPSPLPETPEAVDFDLADQDTLIQAIRQRDAFISQLLRRLSSPDANTEFPDWDRLNNVPAELHQELLGLRDRLQEKLRVAEVDLSLQRAKLAREESKLSIKAEHLARQMRQLGLTADEPGSQSAAPRPVSEGPNATQGRRWLQFLQRSNGPGTDGK